ncbi:MAG: lipoyl(octanoyl) transferase LipB [Bacteroidia bacterium]|jgi:lipoyl(octanoyl) transferase
MEHERLVAVEDWGLIDYKSAWDRQEELFKLKADLKLQNRNLPEVQQILLSNHLILCQHPHVYTLGKSGSPENLLVNAEQLKDLQATYYPINRGGDITYHGPGQIVAYPIFDLEQFFTDIHRYLRTLEEAIILTLAEYQIKGERYDGYTGVWLDAHDDAKARKICAMGVRCSRWITMHGLAFNVNTDLTYFDHIVPCGIDDKQVTSMEKELGHAVSVKEVQDKLLRHLFQLFQLRNS